MRRRMSPIPKTAPFAEEEIDLLNRVVGTASPVQRAWLAGFLAGLDASGANVMPHPATPAGPAEPLAGAALAAARAWRGSCRVLLPRALHLCPTRRPRRVRRSR